MKNLFLRLRIHIQFIEITVQIFYFSGLQLYVFNFNLIQKVSILHSI